MAAKKPKTRQIVRDAKNGQFLPKSAAKRRPSTTVTETRPVGKKKRR